MCTVNTEHNSSRQKIIDHYFFSFVHASFGGPLDEVVPGFSVVPAKVPAAGSIEQNGKTSNKLNWICSLVANRRQIFAQNMHTILFQENTRYNLQSGRNASISFSTEQTNSSLPMAKPLALYRTNTSLPKTKALSTTYSSLPREFRWLCKLMPLITLCRCTTYKKDRRNHCRST
jgi:hypothetical protein